MLKEAILSKQTGVGNNYWFRQLVKGTPSKGASGAGSGQKPSGNRPVDHSLSASPGPVVSVSKGRSVATTKNSGKARHWFVF